MANNEIFVTVSNKSQNVGVGVSGGNNKIGITGDNSQYFSNEARKSAEQAKQSATEAQNFAEQAENSKDELLNDTGFVAVKDNLDSIITTAVNIEDINTNAENIEAIKNASSIALDKADRDLSNLSEAGQAKFDEKADKTVVDGKVNKAGDTMTGSLIIDGGVQQHAVVLKTKYAYNEILSTSAGVGKFIIWDKNDKYMTQIGCERYTDGSTMSLLRVHSPADPSKTSQIYVKANSDGTFYTYAPTPATGDSSTKIATTAYCVNMRCTTKATTTSSASAARPAWIVQNYVNGTSWYRVWSDGWIEQGGGNNTTSGDPFTITFPKAFSNTNYTFTGMLLTTNTTSANGYLIGYSKTAKSCAITIGSINSSNGYSWYACGY